MRKKIAIVSNTINILIFLYMGVTRLKMAPLDSVHWQNFCYSSLLRYLLNRVFSSIVSKH